VSKIMFVLLLSAAGLFILSGCRSVAPAAESTPLATIARDEPYSVTPAISRPTNNTDVTQSTMIAPQVNTTGATQSPAIVPSPNILDNRQAIISLDVSKIGQIALIGEGFQFTEGPAWNIARGVLLFSDINANSIYQLTLPYTITVFRESSNKSNGLAFDLEGRLLAAEHGSRSITRTSQDGTIETLASSYTGKQLNSPNDVVIRKDGNIYFTDPTYGLENRTRGVDFTGLYRLNPSGEIILEGKFDKSPNGVALSKYLIPGFDNRQSDLSLQYF
jgi:gluconolactonase